MRTIILITTHYPYGTIQENWVAIEIEKMVKHFERVIVLPIKELSGRRELPPGVELWQPLASSNRAGFFLGLSPLLATWRYFFDAMRCALAEGGITLQKAVLSFKFACYRLALERHVALQRCLESGEPAVVYAYWGHIPALAIPAAKRLGAATCVRYHGTDLYLEFAVPAGFCPWRRETRANTDLSVFVSDHGMQYFLAIKSLPVAGRTVVARLGSRDYGAVGNHSRNEDNATLVVASASWIIPIKRVDLIARCVGALAAKRKVIWHHFGTGEFELINSDVEAAKAAGADVKLHGQVSTTQLQSFYRQNRVDIFMNLSASEGVPVSIMEALNANIPVVATNAGGTGEAVVDGHSGMLVSVDLAQSPDILADRILEQLQPDGLIARAKPRDFWEKKLNADTLAERFVGELSDLLVTRGT